MRGRLFIAGLALCLLAAANPKGGTASPSEKTNQQIAEAVNNLAAAIEKQSEAPQYSEPCGPESRNRNSDLCAQWYAADAARSAANIAFWVGIVGSFIGALTLGAAWLAARYAKAAAEATKRTADYAADTSAADLRPYLFVAQIIPVETGPGLYRFEIVLQNYGKLPARNILIQHNACFTASPDHIPCDVLRVEKLGISVCAPGHERRVFERILLNPEEQKAFDAGYGSIILRVRFRYRGGPRKRPYAERVDYAYRASSESTGHVYIVTANERRPWQQPDIPHLLRYPDEED